jgi:uncharacterized protein (DUF1501 family)
MSGPFVFSRRRFLQQTGAFGAFALAQSLDKLGLSAASAQSPGYRALVCVYLFGGNDADNMVMPFTNYAQYAAARNATNSPYYVPQTGTSPDGVPAMLQIAPLNTGGTVYGLHPSMPGLQGLFNAGRLAVVANTGSLVEPLTRAEYRAGTKKRPDNLFSHSDQQVQSQTSITQDSLSGITGWAGRLCDRVVGLNAPAATPMSMSFSGNQPFGSGTIVRTLSLPPANPNANFGYAGDAASPSAQQIARANARAALVRADDSNLMVAATQGISESALNSSVLLNPVLRGADSGAVTGAAFPATGLGNQLKSVAKVIEQRTSLGHSARQIFFVSVGGFDTHSNQQGGHPGLMTQVSQAMTAFYNFTVAAGVASNVTAFTMSDFARTFKSNGSGTDHAWGGHALVLGGAVIGQRMYGTYPNLTLNGPDDTGGEGRWVPTTSIEQYGATLGRWFGASTSDLDQVFPNLKRFATPNLGFMA